MITLVASSLLRKVKDKILAVNLVALPLLLIVILGNALGSMFEATTDTSAITVKVAVVDEDRSAKSQAFTTYVESSNVFDVTVHDTAKECEAALSEKSADVSITIPTGFGTAQPTGTVIMQALDNNIDYLHAARASIQTYSDAIRASGYVAQRTEAEPVSWELKSFNKTEAGSAADPSTGVSGITYYGITMLVLVLIYGLANTMNFVREEYEGALGDRYLVSPVRRVSLVLSQVVAGSLVTFVQGMVIFLMARFVFGAHYGDQIWPLIGMIAVIALTMNCVGLLLGLMASQAPVVDPLVTLLIPVLTFLGGGFVRISFGGLERLTPNGAFQHALFHIVAGGPFPWLTTGVCAAVTVVVLVLATALLTRKQNR